MADMAVWGVGTPRTLRVHWVLEELGLPYQVHRVAPRSDAVRSDEYVRLNPTKKVPTLTDDGFVLTESGAIVNYLLRKHGGSKGLVPPAAAESLARYEEWCYFCLMELDATSTYVIRRHLDMPGTYGDAPAAVSAARTYCERALDTAAMRLGSSPFVMGESFSGADILLTTCLNSAVHRDMSVPRLLLDYRNRMIAREAYQRALERNKPD